MKLQGRFKSWTLLAYVNITISANYSEYFFLSEIFNGPKNEQKGVSIYKEPTACQAQNRVPGFSKASLLSWDRCKDIFFFLESIFFILKSCFKKSTDMKYLDMKLKKCSLRSDGN